MTVSLTRLPRLREIGESDRLRDVTHQQVCNAVGAVDALVPAEDRRLVMAVLGLVASPPPLPGAGRHGTYSRYTSGCRCPECGAANTAYNARYRDRPRPEVAS